MQAFSMCPTDYQSASEQRYIEQDSSPSKSDLDSSQDDSSDNSGAEPETCHSQINHRKWVQHKWDSSEDSQGSELSPPLSIDTHKNSIDLEVMNARTSLNDTRRKIALLSLNSQRRIDSERMQGLNRLWTKLAKQYTSTPEGRGHIQHYTWGTWHSTPVKRTWREA